MRTECCEVCKQPLDVCPYGGDCGEMQTIYREWHREQMRDIEVDEDELDEFYARKIEERDDEH